MRTSNVVGFVVWLGLVGALVGFEAQYWSGLQSRTHLETALVFGGMVFVAYLIAATFTRIVEPDQPTPIVWRVLGFVGILASIFNTSNDPGDAGAQQKKKIQDSALARPTGKLSRLWAVIGTVLLLGVYGLGFKLVHDLGSGVFTNH